MKSTLDEVKQLHPHMSDNFQELIARDLRIILGHCCVILRSQKTAGQVKALVDGWIQDGVKAEKEHDAYMERMHLKGLRTPEQLRAHQEQMTVDDLLHRASLQRPKKARRK